MSIKQWPKSEMPREKLLSKGAKYLSDAELLAIFLNTGTKEKNAIVLARELLDGFGNLRNLLNSPFSRLGDVKGIGKGKYALLHAALELGRRYLAIKLTQGSLLSNTHDTKAFLTAQLRDYPQEVFACIFLNNRHRVIAFEELFQGTLNESVIYPREIIKKVIEHHACAVIFAHNHPSGEAKPSEADKSITQELQTALLHLNVNVLDHFIIGDNEIFSFKEQGWL